MPTAAEYQRALQDASGNRAEAARSLGVQLSSMHAACDRLGLACTPGRLRETAEPRDCENCGGVIEFRGGSVARYNRRRFCSRACKDSAQVGQKRTLAPREEPGTAECAGCGRPFERRASELRRHRRHFCSVACRRSGKVVACAACGTEIWRAASQIVAAPLGRFTCSDECRKRVRPPLERTEPAPAGAQYPAALRTQALDALTASGKLTGTARMLGIPRELLRSWRDAETRRAAVLPPFAVRETRLDGRRVYTSEFRSVAVRQLLTGEVSLLSLSRSSGIAPSVLRSWKKGAAGHRPTAEPDR